MLEDDFGPPLVIGGLGGSGTRVFTRVVQLGGIFMGAGLPESEDAVALEDFADKWTVPYVTARMSGRQLDGIELMAEEFQECMQRHRGPIAGTDTPWGWKKPQSIHLLPFLVEQFPELRFVHVIRDGRDLAFGGRARPEVTRAYLGPNMEDKPESVRLLAFWAAANRIASDIGERALRDRYLVLRFEDMCLRPESTIERLLEFSGVTADRELVARGVAEVELSESLGRWRSADSRLVAEAVKAGERAMKQFGYS